MKYYGRYKKRTGDWGEWKTFNTYEEARLTCEFLAKDGVISGKKQIEICTEDEFKKKYESKDEKK